MNAIVARRMKVLGLALALPLSALAADNVPPETLDVKVYPDRYIAAGKPFATLPALEAWAKPIVLQEIWVDSCGPASARQALVAAERFQSTYKKAVRIRSLASTEKGCVAMAERTR